MFNKEQLIGKKFHNGVSEYTFAANPNKDKITVMKQDFILHDFRVNYVADMLERGVWKIIE